MWFEMAHSMRALSPFHVALREARRMARHYRHFEEGGTVPTEGRVEDQHNEQEYELPRDIDPMLVALAIDEKLREGQTAPGIGDDPTMPLERRAGGRIVVAGHHLLRLGDGNFAKGKRFMHSLIARFDTANKFYRGASERAGSLFDIPSRVHRAQGEGHDGRKAAIHRCRGCNCPDIHGFGDILG
jgi:hypothetical protein